MTRFIRLTAVEPNGAEDTIVINIKNIRVFAQAPDESNARTVMWVDGCPNKIHLRESVSDICDMLNDRAADAAKISDSVSAVWSSALEGDPDRPQSEDVSIIVERLAEALLRAV